MKIESENAECQCPRDDIAAYLDGELAGVEELVLEEHFASCKICLTEFNSQKGLLSVLDSVMENEGRDIPLPDNFSRIVTINAESNVSGIRSRVERYRALFVCSVLLLVASIGLGSVSAVVFAPIRQFGEQALAVFGIVFHSLFDVGIGLSVVIRYFGQSVFHGSGFMLLLTTVVFLSAVAALSKMILRYNRTT